jgi:hypothetical protein
VFLPESVHVSVPHTNSYCRIRLVLEALAVDRVVPHPGLPKSGTTISRLCHAPSPACMQPAHAMLGWDYRPFGATDAKWQQTWALQLYNSISILSVVINL